MSSDKKGTVNLRINLRNEMQKMALWLETGLHNKAISMGFTHEPQWKCLRINEV